MEDQGPSLAELSEILSKPNKAYHLYKKGRHQSPCPGCMALRLVKAIQRGGV